MKNLTNEQQENIFKFLNEVSKEVQITDYVNIEDIDFENAFESISEKIQDNNGFDIEVIYYSSAIAYLAENDSSLRESLELAYELGFELKNLSSEILASLLKSQNVRDEFYELEEEINDFFAELYEELQEEEEAYYWTEWEVEEGESWFDKDGNEFKTCHKCNEETAVKEDFYFCTHCLTHL